MNEFKKQMKIFDSIANYENIVCPHCFAEDEDSWEHNLDPDVDIKIECPFCEQEYYVVKTITVFYTTSKPGGRGNEIQSR